MVSGTSRRFFRPSPGLRRSGVATLRSGAPNPIHPAGVASGRPNGRLNKSVVSPAHLIDFHRSNVMIERGRLNPFGVDMGVIRAPKVGTEPTLGFAGKTASRYGPPFLVPLSSSSQPVNIRILPRGVRQPIGGLHRTACDLRYEGLRRQQLGFLVDLFD